MRVLAEFEEYDGKRSAIINLLLYIHVFDQSKVLSKKLTWNKNLHAHRYCVGE
jgi:hypothetical protein